MQYCTTMHRAYLIIRATNILTKIVENERFIHTTHISYCVVNAETIELEKKHYFRSV